MNEPISDDSSQPLLLIDFDRNFRACKGKSRIPLLNFVLNQKFLIIFLNFILLFKGVALFANGFL